MVETDAVIQGRRFEDSLLPPCEVVLFHLFPVVKDVAPELSGLGEVIRGYSGCLGGLELFVHHEKLRVSPGVRGVVGYVERDVSYYLDAL